MKLILSNPKKFITPLHDIPTYETTTWKRSNKPIPRTISSTNLLNYRSKGIICMIDIYNSFRKKL